MSSNYGGFPPTMGLADLLRARQMQMPGGGQQTPPPFYTPPVLSGGAPPGPTGPPMQQPPMPMPPVPQQQPQFGTAAAAGTGQPMQNFQANAPTAQPFRVPGPPPMSMPPVQKPGGSPPIWGGQQPSWGGQPPQQGKQVGMVGPPQRMQDVIGARRPGTY